MKMCFLQFKIKLITGQEGLLYARTLLNCNILRLFKRIELLKKRDENFLQYIGSQINTQPGAARN